MKKELPPALIWGGLGVIVLIVVAISYSMFFKAPAQVDPLSIPQDVLADRERPRDREPGQ